MKAAPLRVGVVRREVLGATEVFITQQATSIPNAHVSYVGAERRWATSDDEFRVLGELRCGSLRVKAFTIFRRSPWLRRQMDVGQLDVVLVHFLTDAWMFGPVLEQCHVPVVCVVHGSDVLIDPSQVEGHQTLKRMRRRWPAGFDHVDLFLPVSDFLARTLIEQGIPENKVLRHYLGVPMGESLIPSPSQGGALFVGRLNENKGWLQFLQIVERAMTEHPGLRATLVGDGPDADALKRALVSLGLQEVVTWIRYVPNDGVRSLIAAHDVVVVPSVPVATGAAEGLGRVACEAASLGKPVICFRTGGLPETVIDGGTGFVVEPYDVTTAAQRLSYLLSRPDVALRMGQAGRTFARAHFDIETQGQRLRSVLAAYGQENRGA